MTDISGIRVILFFEHDIEAVSKIISSAFRVDERHSVSRRRLLSVNEVGYRSVHFVCDLGDKRSSLPEFGAFRGFKFEFQIRTVLQHAWAELAHDRSYKLSAKLPAPLERKLFLLAGMLEHADTGFSELSQQIDNYVKEITSYTADDFLKLELDSITLVEFSKRWAAAKGLQIKTISSDEYSDLLGELQQFGVCKVGQLNDIIPTDYEKHIEPGANSIYGFVRDWMMISDPAGFVKKVKVKWILTPEDLGALEAFLSEAQIETLIASIGYEDYEDDIPQ